MISPHREKQWREYQSTRSKLVRTPEILISVEQTLTNLVHELILGSLPEIRCDYDEASFLYPFWSNYPPEDRGRRPIGDQYPWIEVGEHALGAKLGRLLSTRFRVRDTGLPTGSDQRFVLTGDAIETATDGLTDTAWLFVDVKSVGPRDDQNHVVMSHNQISGNGTWIELESGVQNSTLRATGTKSSHDFFASLPPLYVLSDGTVAPLVSIAIKPRYDMVKSPEDMLRNSGQPLLRIDIASIPNGLLLTENPNYLSQYPGLLFPGKDDKSKNPRKLRARVAFDILKRIADWRVQQIHVANP